MGFNTAPFFFNNCHYFGNFLLPSASAGSIRLNSPSIHPHGKLNLLRYCAVKPCLWHRGARVAGSIYAPIRNPDVSVARELPRDSRSRCRGDRRIPARYRQAVCCCVVSGYRIRLISCERPPPYYSLSKTISDSQEGGHRPALVVTNIRAFSTALIFGAAFFPSILRLDSVIPVIARDSSER